MKGKPPPRPAPGGPKNAFDPREWDARGGGRKPKPPHDGRREQRAPRAEARNPYAQQEFTVEGLSALSEYVRFRPEAITQIMCADAARKDVEALLKGSGVDVALKPLQKSERPGEGDAVSPVQARVLVKALDQSELEQRLEVEGRTRDVVLALDHITDPRNLGAIVRSAAFFGVREVIAPERRQVLFTQASVATAQGGFALADLVCVVNLARTLRTMKDAGYWIIGTAMDGEPVPALRGVYEKVVLVLGAEDTGLSHNVRELCDRLAAIAAPDAKRSLDSLNVSVAAGIFLHEFTRNA